jgi:hypothetical protein
MERDMKSSNRSLGGTMTCAAAFAAFALGASGAHAAGVGTYVENYSGLSGNRNFAGYNFTTDSAGNHFYSGGGASTYTACRADVPCATTGGGTPDHVGNATASSNFASMSDTDQGGFSSGSGFARADLSTGELGGSAEGTNRSAFGIGSGIFNRAFSTFGDTVMFTIGDATASTITNIGVNLALHGDLSRSALDTDPVVHAYLNFGGPIVDVAVRLNAAGDAYLQGGASFWDSYTLTQAGDGFLFSGVYALRGASTSVDIGEFLDVQCGNGAACDYDSTAAFSFDLPSNVTFTSASGVFLTRAGADGGVPEPAVWAMMLLGFGGVGATLRRRRSAGLSPA